MPDGHPAYLVRDYDDVPAEVHGGLTFSGRDLHEEIDTGEDVIWFGFDCAHAGDKIRSPTGRELGGREWNLEDVVEETERLAEQLEELSWPDILEHKLRYMPDWFKNRVDIKTKTGDAE